MKFDVISIFPHLIEQYFSESVIKRAQEESIIAINAHDLRDYTHDKHRVVDDNPFSGGPGMVMKIEPIYQSVRELRIKNKESRVVVTSARGKRFTQKKAKEFSKLDQLIVICGRYEGVDERVAEHIADESINVGDYVLSGGELGAMIIIEATARLVPGVLGNRESPDNELFPQYTRPEVFTTKDGTQWRVPEVLLSGNPKLIEEWKKKVAKK